MTAGSFFADERLTKVAGRADGPSQIMVGGWQADRASGELRRGAAVRRLEPKVMDLLFCLAAQPGEPVSRDALMAALWPNRIVGEDALARLVFKLRRALDDNPRAPRLIETLPKRGYRLRLIPEEQPAAGRRRWIGRCAAVAAAAAALVLGLGLRGPGNEASAALLARASDAYFQFTHADNEMAAALYRRVLAETPDDPRALAGLAGALVQRHVRWSGARPPKPGESALGQALADGRLSRPEARADLDRALALATRAAERAPRDAEALRTLGLVRSARGDFLAARQAYRRALAADPDAWGALINLADLEDLTGGGKAVALLERAYGAMSATYGRAPARVRPWQPQVGLEIARRHRSAGRIGQAADWYRRILADYPGFTPALAELARISS
ncbi:winged helix-turn-helix domain-containing protein [Pedomonas mirosovicensis]|uniref:winged helix-turn-helix domain-containing protein n=1 Tax=Pedomonas mirosovicensis TaxID=2908641 RepID=UPI00216A8C5D|nr:winged helix-turn-helix domain-containing protein [Pedomonas mirosovicensis]MCH8686377.1 winged helix-turn-helix domain-containing protein [Pedomonas mirosovicensis]